MTNEDATRRRIAATRCAKAQHDHLQLESRRRIIAMDERHVENAVSFGCLEISERTQHDTGDFVPAQQTWIGRLR